jgi:hypothetical protein
MGPGEETPVTFRSVGHAVKWYANMRLTLPGPKLLVLTEKRVYLDQRGGVDRTGPWEPIFALVEIEGALQALPAVERKLILRHYAGGVSAMDLAAQSEKSPRWVWYTLAAGRKRLTRRLRKEGLLA